MGVYVIHTKYFITLLWCKSRGLPQFFVLFRAFFFAKCWTGITLNMGVSMKHEQESLYCSVVYW